MLSYVTGTVNQELLLRNEYLGAENRILRGQIKGRLLLSEGEKATLADRSAARTESLGRIGGCREAGYAAGLVPKSSSPTNSTDREFTNESVDRELMRKQNG